MKIQIKDMEKLAENFAGRQKAFEAVMEQCRRTAALLRTNPVFEETAAGIDARLKILEEERAQMIRMTMALERIVELYDRCEDTLVREAEGNGIRFSQKLQPRAAAVMLTPEAQKAYEEVLDAGSGNAEM